MNKSKILEIKTLLEKDIQDFFGFSKDCKIKWEQFYFSNHPLKFYIDFCHNQYEDLNFSIFIDFNEENNEDNSLFKMTGMVKQFYSHEIKGSYSPDAIINSAENIIDDFIHSNLKNPVNDIFSRSELYEINDEDDMYASFNTHRRFVKVFKGEKLTEIILKYIFLFHNITVSDSLIEFISKNINSKDLFKDNQLNNRIFYFNNIPENHFIKSEILSIFNNSGDLESIKDILTMNYKV